MRTMLIDVFFAVVNVVLALTVSHPQLLWMNWMAAGWCLALAMVAWDQRDRVPDWVAKAMDE